MSTQMLCDNCGKVISGKNMMVDPLTVEWGSFKAVVTVTSTLTDPALCYDCLLKALTIKPKRKYVRKPALPQKGDGGGMEGAGEAGEPHQGGTDLITGKPDISTCKFAVEGGKCSTPPYGKCIGVHICVNFEPKAD